MDKEPITLATLEKATAQEIFDQVAIHLLTQKQRSADPDGSCLYRNSNGLKCAAGCLMSDDEYNTSMEHKSWSALNRAPLIHSVLIESLQNIHDSISVALWEIELIKLAEHFGLKTNKII